MTSLTVSACNGSVLVDQWHKNININEVINVIPLLKLPVFDFQSSH